MASPRGPLERIVSCVLRDADSFLKTRHFGMVQHANAADKKLAAALEDPRPQPTGATPAGLPRRWAREDSCGEPSPNLAVAAGSCRNRTAPPA
jgi:hypothetical protein